MAETIINGQTCLEKRGIDCRNEQLINNPYSKDNEYSAIHPDAISDGDVNGKGTGGASHGFSLPDCNKPKNLFVYSNFTTDRGGGRLDIEGRNGVGGRLRSITRSLYNQDYQYGADLVNTAVNRELGQISMEGRKRY